jgi:hypothetical protein
MAELRTLFRYFKGDSRLPKVDLKLAVLIVLGLAVVITAHLLTRP